MNSISTTLLPFLISLGYVISGLIVSSLLKKLTGDFFARKLLHIFMACWWFLRLYFIETRFLWLGPLAFMLIFLIYETKKAKKQGMWQFCLSLTLLTLITEYTKAFEVCATAAVFILGFGDSLAALAGKQYQKRRNTDKPYSIFGSLTLFTVSSLVMLICFKTSLNIGFILAVSAVVTVVEAKIFPKMDNITVPLTVFILTSSVSFIKQWL